MTTAEDKYKVTIYLKNNSSVIVIENVVKFDIKRTGSTITNLEWKFSSDATEILSYLSIENIAAVFQEKM